jgi:hypothetical protein
MFCLSKLFKRSEVKPVVVEPTVFTLSKFDSFTCIGYIARIPVDGEVLEFWSDALENETLEQFKNRISNMVKYSKVQFVEDFK